MPFKIFLTNSFFAQNYPQKFWSTENNFTIIRAENLYFQDKTQLEDFHSAFLFKYSKKYNKLKQLLFNLKGNRLFYTNVPYEIILFLD